MVSCGYSFFPSLLQNSFPPKCGNCLFDLFFFFFLFCNWSWAGHQTLARPVTVHARNFDSGLTIRSFLFECLRHTKVQKQSAATFSANRTRKGERNPVIKKKEWRCAERLKPRVRKPSAQSQLLRPAASLSWSPIGWVRLLSINPP